MSDVVAPPLSLTLLGGKGIVKVSTFGARAPLGPSPYSEISETPR